MSGARVLEMSEREGVALGLEAALRDVGQHV
jgi:hypothetical protein